MISLTIEIDEQTAEAFRQFAAQEQRPEGEMRDALALYFQSARRPLPRGVGQYRSGRSDVSVQVRELLHEAGRKGQWP
jgi:hypothetical protein